MAWDTLRYDDSFGYVVENGAKLVDLLAPRPGERVLDLGCGTGTVTAEIAARGATTVGLDADADMIAAARAKHPELNFEVGDGHSFATGKPYDAVFSNAALHWMLDPEAVIARVRKALLPGGRFVAEMGAAGNVAAIIEATRTARAELGLDAGPRDPWYFPTPARHATRLEAAGFTVRLMHYFVRDTPLTRCPDGPADWLRMFGGDRLLAGAPAEQLDRVLARVNELTRASLLHDGQWWLHDYTRLRFVAVAGT